MVDAKLGKTYLVALPQHIAEDYSRADGGTAPVDTGTVRPVLVVGTDVEKDDGKGNSWQRANVLVYRDSGAPPFYVQGVPFDALSDLEDTPAAADALADKDTPDEEKREWSPNLEGNGSTYQGPGPYAPDLTNHPQTSPDPNVPTQGVSTQTTGNTPQAQDVNPGGDRSWQSNAGKTDTTPPTPPSREGNDGSPERW